MTVTAEDVQAVQGKGAKAVDITSQLARSVAFVVVSVHMWRGQYNIKGAKVEVSDKEVSAKLTTHPRWYLIPPEWRERFQTIESKLKGCVLKAKIINPDDEDQDVKQVLRFPIRGVSIIPRSRLVDLFEQLEDIESTEFKTAIAQFEAKWPDIIEWAKGEVKEHPPEVWNAIRAIMPKSGSEAAKRFSVEKVVIPIQIGSAMDLEYLSGQDATKYIGKMKEYGKNFTKIVADTIIVGLQDELNDAVDTLVNRVGEGGVIKNSNLQAVQNVFEKYKSFDFLMTPDLQDQMFKLATQLGELDAQDLNKALKETGATSVTAKLADHLKVIRTQCAEQSAVIRAHGRGKRTIKV